MSSVRWRPSLSRALPLFAAAFLFLLGPRIPADDLELINPTESRYPDPALSPVLSSCPELPAGAVAVEYRFFPMPKSRHSVSRKASDGMSEGVSDRASDSDADGLGVPPVLRTPPYKDGLLIGSVAAFHELFGEAAPEIGWDSSRMLVVEESRTYRRNDLENETRITGVHVTEDSLIVIPKTPERVLFRFCRIGDCPPNIP